jgi:hypothetical protein
MSSPFREPLPPDPDLSIAAAKRMLDAARKDAEDVKFLMVHYEKAEKNHV